MAIMVRRGRAVLAAAVKALPIHVALGLGNPAWDTDKAGSFTFGGDGTFVLPHVPAQSVVVKSQDGATTYVAGQDYGFAADGTVTRDPDGAIPEGATVQVDWHVGRPAEDPARTALLAEVGRRLADETAFVTPDPEGGIVVPSGRYAISAEKTNHLFVRVRLDFADAAIHTIRELGVFIGSQVAEGLPAGQRYFTPEQVQDLGDLLLLQHSVPIVRQASTRETFEFVHTF